jgi:hypothetical protein
VRFKLIGMVLVLQCLQESVSCSSARVRFTDLREAVHSVSLRNPDVVRRQETFLEGLLH